MRLPGIASLLFLVHTIAADEKLVPVTEEEGGYNRIEIGYSPTGSRDDLGGHIWISVKPLPDLDPNDEIAKLGVHRIIYDLPGDVNALNDVTLTKAEGGFRDHEDGWEAQLRQGKDSVPLDLLTFTSRRTGNLTFHLDLEFLARESRPSPLAGKKIQVSAETRIQFGYGAPDDFPLPFAVEEFLNQIGIENVPDRMNRCATKNGPPYTDSSSSGTQRFGFAELATEVDLEKWQAALRKERIKDTSLLDFDANRPPKWWLPETTRKTADFYEIEMKAEGDGWIAIVPSTKRIYFYQHEFGDPDATPLGGDPFR